MDPGAGDPNLTYDEMNPNSIHALLLPFLMRLRGMGGLGGLGGMRQPVDPGFYKNQQLHYPEEDGPFPGASGSGGGPAGLLSMIQNLGGVVDGAIGGHIPARTGTGGVHGTPPHAPTQGYAPGGVNYMQPKPVASRGGYAPGGVSYKGVRQPPHAQGNPMANALRQAALRARAGLR